MTFYYYYDLQNHIFFQPGLIKIRTSVHFLCDNVFVPYSTFRRSFKDKYPLSGAKTQVKYVNTGIFYYVDIGTYCCVFVTLLQKHIAAVQNSNIQGLSLKVNALSCWKYALHQTQP